MPTGKVKWFNSKKGYGFIKDDETQKDIFLHVSALEESKLRVLKEDQKIFYDIKEEKNKLAGVIFTGNRPPHQNIINLMKQCNMPAMISKNTSYDISKKITTHLVKIRYEEYEKIETIKKIIKEHVDIDEIIKDYYS